MALLQVENMTHYFGGLRAVHQYNLQIEPGQIRGLIGPNGAGKTTIFNLLTGIHRPTEGKITLEGESLVGLQPYQIASMGLGRTFQNLLLWRHIARRLSNGRIWRTLLKRIRSWLRMMRTNFHLHQMKLKK